MKKTLIYALLTVCLLWSCSNAKDSVDIHHEDKSSDASVTGNFGEAVEEINVVSVSQMYEQLKAEGDFEGKVVGQIKEVCSNKGCWMTLELPDGQDMRVTFKDYGFFVPLESQGYPVIIEGVASISVTDVATLKHYAEDAGKPQEEIDAIIESKEEYSFEAIGVIIKENV